MAHWMLSPRQTILLFLLPTAMGQAQSRTDDFSITPEAASYLRGALDTIQTVTLDGDSLPWKVIRDSALLLARGAQRPRDTYGAIAWALHRANKHSFLQAGRPGAVSEMLLDRYGYVRVPSRGGAAVALADSLHSAVGRLDAAGACGWIVDLRANGGGNMWPMLAGIGPLLGDSLVGAFGEGATADRWYYHRGSSGILHPDGRLELVTHVTVPPVDLRQPRAPVAILIDGGTGSSGEDIAIAFRGRPNVRTFGSPSAGFTTTNRGSALPDGANMVVTTGYNADRTGTLYTQAIQPDSLVPVASTGWPFATDAVGSAAVHWLAAQADCRRAE